MICGMMDMLFKAIVSKMVAINSLHASDILSF